MRVNRWLVPTLALVALFGTVLVAQATGNFATNGRAGSDLARLTAADLKGWMTLQDVMNGLGISQGELYAMAKLPAEIAPTTLLNKLETQVPGFSVTTLRETLTVKLGSNSTAQPGAPNSASATVAVPDVASTSTLVTSAVHVTPTALPQGQVLPANQIKGSMTLKSASQQAAVPLDQVIAGLKLPPDTNVDTPIKDLVVQGKLTQVTDVQKVVAELQGN